MTETLFLFDCKDAKPVVIRAATSDIAVERGLKLIGAQLKKKEIESAEVTAYAVHERMIGSQAKIIDEPVLKIIVSTLPKPATAGDDNNNNVDQ